jgi:hypothetical protein
LGASDFGFSDLGAEDFVSDFGAEDSDFASVFFGADDSAEFGGGAGAGSGGVTGARDDWPLPPEAGESEVCSGE